MSDTWKLIWMYHQNRGFIYYFADCPTTNNQHNTLLQNTNSGIVMSQQVNCCDYATLIERWVLELLKLKVKSLEICSQK